MYEKQILRHMLARAGDVVQKDVNDTTVLSPT